MNKKRHFWSAPALILSAVLLLATCQPYVEEDDIIAVTDIKGIPGTGTIGTLTLVPAIEPANATNQAVTWSIVDAGTTQATYAGSIITTRANGTIKLTAEITNGVAKGKPYRKNFEIVISDAFVPVQSITVTPTTGTVGISFTLTGEVNPVNATNRTITWNVPTGGATISDGIFLTQTPGSYLVQAIIANGKGPGDDFTASETIIINNFVAATNISGIAPKIVKGTNYKLEGTVEPSNASYQVITWSVKSAGSTGASITGDILTASTAGNITVTASVANGKTIGTPYTQDINIEIANSDIIPVTGITGIPSDATVGTIILSGTVAPSNATNKTIVWTAVNDAPTAPAANINGNNLTVSRKGTVKVRATITNGTGPDTDYTHDYTIRFYSEAERILEGFGGGAWANDLEDKIVVPSGDYTVSKDITVPGNIELSFVGLKVSLNIPTNRTVTVKGKLFINDGTELSVLGEGVLNLDGEATVVQKPGRNDGKLTINKTVNITGTTEIQGELIINSPGKVLVKDKGLLRIYNGPDNDLAPSSNNKGKISGSGIIEVLAGGTLEMPDPAADNSKFSLGGISDGKIIIYSEGMLFLLGLVYIDPTWYSVRFPFIGNDNQTTGVEYQITEGCIEITVETRNGSAVPAFTLDGKANALGAINDSAGRHPIIMAYSFTVKGELTIGIPRGTTSNKSTVHVGDEKEENNKHGKLINNGLITININSELVENKKGEVTGISTIKNNNGIVITGVLPEKPDEVLWKTNWTGN
jgi:hypothetical protein